MSANTRPIPVVDFSAVPAEGLIFNVSPDGDTCVILAAGELDHASRHQLLAATTAGNHPAMVIDLTSVTFMDCSGYGSLVESRLILERAGRTLTIKGQTGEPARLFHQIAKHTDVLKAVSAS